MSLRDLWKSGKVWNSPLLGEFKAPKPGEHMLGPIQKVDVPMRRYPNDEEVDFCIVGLGAGGGVMLQRLAKAGFSVVGFDAGPFWDTERDWLSDEAGSHKLYWNDLRIIGGENPLTLGENNSGRALAAAPCTGRPSRPASIRQTFASTPRMAWPSTGRSPIGICSPITP